MDAAGVEVLTDDLEDHDDFFGVDGDLTGAAASGEPYLRPVVVADNRRIDIPKAVDLGPSQKSDVDQTALEVVVEDFNHGAYRDRVCC